MNKPTDVTRMLYSYFNIKHVYLSVPFITNISHLPKSKINSSLITYKLSSDSTTKNLEVDWIQRSSASHAWCENYCIVTHTTPHETVCEDSLDFLAVL